MNDEAMLFDPEKSQFFQLNPTAALIWNQLAEPSTAEQLAGEVANRFEGASSPDVLRDIHGLLEQMVAHRLVVVLE